MNKPYFVILNHQNGSHLPLTDDDGNMLFFDSESFAISGAESSVLGSEFGYEVFELGCGL